MQFWEGRDVAKFKAEIVGVFGEDIAARYLQGKGYELATFGGDDKTAASKLVKGLPRITRYWIGSSRADLATLQFKNDNSWVDGNLPEWADLSNDIVDTLTTTCKATSKCRMRDSSVKKSPCASETGLFERANLKKTYPLGVSIQSRDGVQLKRSAMHFAYDCSNHFAEIIASDYLGDVIPLGGFMRDNHLISGYIQKTWEKYAVGEMKLPYSGEDIRKAGMSTPKAEEMKDANRLYMRQQQKRFPAGHPGRFDFVAKDGLGLVAVEVKVNTSKMSYWQELRFMLLNKMGHRTMLLNIKGDHANLEMSYSGGGFEGVTVEAVSNPPIAIQELEGYSFESVMSTVPRNRIYF